MSNIRLSLDEALAAMPVIAVLRFTAPGSQVMSIARILAAEGVHALEVTTNTPGWEDILEELADLDQVAVGLGTVMSPEQVSQAARLGARFVVSPHVSEPVIRAAINVGVEPLPGAATPTEIVTAQTAGARYIKLFPAGALGISYLSALRGPFATTDFVPTGGIEPGDAAAWISAGAKAVGLGGGLVTGSLDMIKERTALMCREIYTEMGLA